jgi:hypothetical protein
MKVELFGIKNLPHRTISKWTLFACFNLLSMNTIAQNPGEWTWVHGDSSLNYSGNYGTMGVPSPTNKPPGIYEGAEWTDNLGNFWLYGGESVTGWGDNLWKYNVTTNMWTWIKGSGNVFNKKPKYGQQGIPDSANSPGARVTSQTWRDNNGDLWLFGGSSYFAFGIGEAYNDLWKYEISTNKWTWMKGDPVPNGVANYGIKGVESSSNKPPSSKESNLTWTDNQNNLWLLDLKGCLWKYKISTNNWIWMKGDTTGVPSFGQKGIPNMNNSPGNTFFSFTRWMDSNDNLWLLYSGLDLYYTTLFKYQINTNMWTWISGDTIINNSIPDYGNALCDYDKTLVPYRRGEARACWIDHCDNLWLMGGYGCDNSGCDGLNDLIYFDTQAFKWIRAGNDTTFNSPSIYGTIGNSSPLNKPSARTGALPFKDLDGNLWFFGGAKHNTQQFFGDLWKYQMDAGCPLCVNPYAGITENETPTNEISVFPNPFNQQTTIQINDHLENATLFVYNSCGQKIKELNNISGQSFTFSRDNFSQGFYFLQLIQKNVSYTSKILITED